jgi:hypothetical protein
MKHAARSLLVAGAALAACLAVAAAPSSAAEPLGGCPTAAGFFLFTASLFPATLGGGQSRQSGRVGLHQRAEHAGSGPAQLRDHRRPSPVVAGDRVQRRPVERRPGAPG